MLPYAGCAVARRGFDYGFGFMIRHNVPPFANDVLNACVWRGCMSRGSNRGIIFWGRIGDFVHRLLCGNIPAHYAWDISWEKSYDEMLAIWFWMCIWCLASESATVTDGVCNPIGRVTTTERSAEQYESAHHTATPHGECHGLWMAVGVAGQPILPQWNVERRKATRTMFALFNLVDAWTICRLCLVLTLLDSRRLSWFRWSDGERDMIGITCKDMKCPYDWLQCSWGHGRFAGCENPCGDGRIMLESPRGLARFNSLPFRYVL